VSALTAAPSRGFVSIVGAGPGDPDLLTRRALRRLQQADVVFHDGLVPDAILRLAPYAEHRSVAKRARRRERTQDEITSDLIATARRGWRVVRLKSGDPFVFGRGGEEALALDAAGVPYEIVPGVSSAIAAPALAGIPVTHRGLASAFVVVTGHDARTYGPIVNALTPGSATLVVLMGLGSRAELAGALIARGWSRSTPAAIVANASQPAQSTWTGTIDSLGSPAPAFESPAVIVIGRVAALARPSAVSTLEDGRTWQLSTIHRR